jgi:hypothetical protein
VLVTQENKELFWRQGAVLIRGTFRDWVAPLEDGIESLMHRLKTEITPATGGTYGIALDYQKPFAGGAMVVNAAPFEPVFTEWQERSDAAELVADLLDSRYVRAWVDAIFIKEHTPDAASDVDLGADVDLSTWDSDPAVTPWHKDVFNSPFWGEKMAIVGGVNGHRPRQRTPPDHRRIARRVCSLPFAVRDPIGRLAAVSSVESIAGESQLSGVPAKGVVHACRGLRRHALRYAARVFAADSRCGRRLSYSYRWLGDDVIYQPNALTRTLDPATSGAIPMRPGEPLPDRCFPRTWTRASPHSSSTCSAGLGTPDEIRA